MDMANFSASLNNQWPLDGSQYKQTQQGKKI
jgi:hypothetical protein